MKASRQRCTIGDQVLVQIGSQTGHPRGGDRQEVGDHEVDDQLLVSEPMPRQQSFGSFRPTESGETSNSSPSPKV
jgi:hypothetical protein